MGSGIEWHLSATQFVFTIVIVILISLSSIFYDYD